MKVAYLNCIGGASGDMLLGALVDAGVSIDWLDDLIRSLNVGGVSLSAEIGSRNGVTGTLVSVNIAQERVPLRWQEMSRIVEESCLGETVIKRAVKVFRRLAEAEALVHRTEITETHFHELGDLDTLVDVVGTIAGIEALEIDCIYSSPLPSGSGIIDSAHGILPIPAPATAALFSLSKAPVVAPPNNVLSAGEMVTPTGAAIITTLATFEQPDMRFENVGYGLGRRDNNDYPNVVALWIGVKIDDSHAARLVLLETNIDDMSAEQVSFTQERLFNLGALDVWFTPIQMKKNRPGTMISALVPASLESQAASLIMTETTTLGVRVTRVTRYESERKLVDVKTSFGTVSVKMKRLNGCSVSVSPEYEDCRAIALDTGVPLQEVYRRVKQEASDELLPN
ncbi:MAG: nickel pincer cofactor biosynthesis protein LarC [SAR202 cluster bacterium]|nr:nickel pincer cofactor biosynthesis protein LarC [SAR202 cluster bacterium]